MESFSVGHKVSLSINPKCRKRIGSYKLEANKYVRLKLYIPQPVGLKLE